MPATPRNPVLLRVDAKTGEAREARAPGKPVKFDASDGARLLVIADDAQLAARLKNADRIPLQAREKIVDVASLLAEKRAKLDATKAVAKAVRK